MKSIYVRNFVATALMIAICLMVVVCSVVGIGQGYVIREYTSRMKLCADEVAYTAAAFSENGVIDTWGLGMTFSSISKATGNQIFLTDLKGCIQVCSDDPVSCAHIGKTVPGDILFALYNDGYYEGVALIDQCFDSERIIVSVPVENADRPQLLGYVFINVERGNVFSPWKTFLLVALAIVGIVFIAILMLAFWYSRHMTKPLDEIAAASRMFARGDFSVRVRQRSDPSDEMGSLIESFNKMADSLENSEKRRSEFISNVSHELRTPMTTIAGFADGILDGTIPKEEEYKYLLSIRDETRRLARLVRSMLYESKTSASAADPKRRSNFDITELVVQTLLSFEQRANEKSLDVDPQFPDQSIVVRADKDGITQVIYNLLDNAVKFSENGSCITLRIYKDDGKAYVSVKDKGETIPPDDLPYIFDRFHKSDRSRSLDKDGVGLGLSLVKTIINSHDEDIAVRSENGETEFVFTLPLAE